MDTPDLSEDTSAKPFSGMRVGFDLVQISRISDSIKQFGDLFKQRLFTKNELDYAHAGDSLCSERLAARFAAKEAVIKALQLANAGVGLRDIEVCKLHDGGCEVLLHGRVDTLANAMGVSQISLSLSHEGDYAGAMVSVLFAPPKFHSLY